MALTNKEALSGLIIDIGNAIRATTGTTEQLTLAQMPDMIMASPGNAFYEIAQSWNTNVMWETIAKHGDTIRANPNIFKAFIGSVATYTSSYNNGSVTAHPVQSVRVVDICHYDRSDGKGKAAFTFEHANGSFNAAINTYDGRSNAYPASNIKSILNGAFFNGMPEGMRKSIVSVNVPCFNGQSTRPGLVTSVDKVFIISMAELLNLASSDPYSTLPKEGSLLTYYQRAGVTANFSAKDAKLMASLPSNTGWNLGVRYTRSLSNFGGYASGVDQSGVIFSGSRDHVSHSSGTILPMFNIG